MTHLVYLYFHTNDTVQWISNLKRKPSTPSQDATSHSPTAEPDSAVSYESEEQTIIFARNESLSESNIVVPQQNSNAPLGSQAEFVDGLLKQWSDQIFQYGFETIFGLLVGRNGCPFVYVLLGGLLEAGSNL